MIAGLIVLVAVFLPIPLPFVVGLAVLGLIVAGLVALIS